MKYLKKTSDFLLGSDGSLQKRTIRSGIWVGFSTIGLNTMNLLRSIILARILSPEIFGIMSITMIVVHGIEIFTNTGFYAALIHRQEGFEEARDTAFSLTVIRGILLALVVFALAPIMSEFYDKPVLNSIIKIIAIIFLINGLQNINTVALAKELDFRRLTYLSQSVAVANFLIVIILAYILRSVWALVIAQIITAALNTILSYILIPGKPKFAFKMNRARQLFNYGKFITGVSIVLFIARESDNFAIGKILGITELGYYVIAYTLANLPATQISKLISQIMFPAYSKLQNNYPALKEAYLIVLRLVSTMTVPIALGLIFLAPEIISIVYGYKWMPAVVPLQVLSVFGLIRSVSSINGYLLNGIGKPQIDFYGGAARVFVLAIIIYPLTQKFGIIGTSWAVTSALLVHFMILLYHIRKHLSVNIKDMINAFSPVILKSIVMVIPIVIFKIIFPVFNILILGSAMIICLIVYGALNFKDIQYFLKNRTNYIG